MDDGLIPTLTPPEGRDETGRFTPGNKAAKNNRGRARMQELRDALLEAGTPERIAEVEASLREMAIGGDVSAAKLWLGYMVGMPIQAVEVSTPDGKTLDVALVAAVVMEAIGDDQAARLRVASAFAALGRRQDREEGGDGMGE